MSFFTQDNTDWGTTDPTPEADLIRIKEENRLAAAQKSAFMTELLTCSPEQVIITPAFVDTGVTFTLPSGAEMSWGRLYELDTWGNPFRDFVRAATKRFGQGSFKLSDLL